MTFKALSRLFSSKAKIVRMIENQDYILPDYGPNVHDLLYNFFFATCIKFIKNFLKL